MSSTKPRFSSQQKFLWPRRRTLKTFALAGLGITTSVQSLAQSVSTTSDPENLSADNSVSCVLSPQQTEGPYYFNLDAMRTDITEGKPGLPLQLQLRVVDIEGCRPVSDAIVDIWHCDAEGEYSGFDSGSWRRWGRGKRDNDKIFLRGIQVSNPRGEVTFHTIYPGCYSSRTTHIHAKVYLNEKELVTTQLYFPDAITESVYRNHPLYRTDRDTNNSNDRIMSRARGAETAMLSLQELDEGYLGTLTLGVRRS